ncbi:MAG: cydA, partial [Candidatus Aminicenantes bacterium]|jgi:cytochrome d ubiquinol oxidase subunit I|nr:cydA [Candidatus Aminicenantes bacterium]
MILLGLGFIAMGAWGFWLQARKKLVTSRGFLKLLIFAVPLPYLANELGWIAAEVGRQPWAVYKVLRTADAASSVVPAGNILFSIVLFTLIYTLIGVVGLRIILKTVRGGPDGEAATAGKGAV